jgi:hypothetical protein
VRNKKPEINTKKALPPETIFLNILAKKYSFWLKELILIL